MNVLVISDSHGLVDELVEVIERHRDEVDAIFHCGDSELDLTHPVLKDVITVKGNCDAASFPEEKTVVLNGETIYVTHGHKYDVKRSYVPLTYRAEEVGATLVFFGHSHLATAFEQNGIVFVNPGSIRSPRQSEKKTYSLCTSNATETVITFYDRDGSVVDEKSFSKK